MRRMGGRPRAASQEISGVDGNGNGGRATPTIASNMSYTNLAEMASAFETHQRVVPAARRKRPADSVDAETAYAAAMASINTGLQLDASEALADALAQYQEGADALSQALERAEPGETSDNMQQTLDMVEERIRHITQRSAAAPLTDSGMVTALLPPELVDPTLSPPTFVAGGRESPSDAAERAFNLFDLQAEARLPAPLRAAYRSFGNVFDELGAAFGFQDESVRCQAEHLTVLLANSASAHGQAAGLGVLHAKLIANYRLWAQQLGEPPHCAAARDPPLHKLYDVALYLFCLLYTSPSPRDGLLSRMPSSA